METKKFKTISGQLVLTLHGDTQILEGTFGDLSKVTDEEYTDFLRRTGVFLKENNTGKLLTDFTNLQNYGLSLRAISVNYTKEFILKSAPYIVVSILKSRSTFDNLATQTVLNMAKPLSEKFLDGKMFEATERDAAIKWLTEFPVPKKFSFG